MPAGPSIALIAVPYDSGLERRIGLGPLRLLDRGLEERLCRDGFRVQSTVVELGDVYPAELSAGFFLHRAVADEAAAALEQGSLPLVLTGNRNSGVIGCVAAAGRTSERRAGVVWFDATATAAFPRRFATAFSTAWASRWRWAAAGRGRSASWTASVRWRRGGRSTSVAGISIKRSCTSSLQPAWPSSVRTTSSPVSKAGSGTASRSSGTPVTKCTSTSTWTPTTRRLVARTNGPSPADSARTGTSRRSSSCSSASTWSR